VRKIALEEHFVTPELAKYGASTSTVAQPQLWAEASRRLLDFTQERLPEMDRFIARWLPLRVFPPPALRPAR